MMLSSLRRRAGVAVLAAPITLAAMLLAAAAPASADGGDRVSFGSSITVQEGQEVTGDLVVFGGNAKVYGHVDGDAVVMGGDLYIAPSGEVDGDTVAFGGTVDNESKTGHQKQRTEPTIPPIPAMPTMPAVPVPPAPYHMGSGDHGPATGWIGFLVVTGILSLIAFAVAPGAVRNVRDEFLKRPLIGTAVGFCWPVILTAVVIALCITVLGVVLIPAAVVALVVAYLVGRAAVALLLGRRLFESANVVEPAPVATAALGLLIITMLEGLVPLWMGIVLEAILGSVAIGASMLPFMRSRHVVVAAPGGYSAPPAPVFTPPSSPPPPGPPAVPQ